MRRNAEEDLRICNCATLGPWKGLRAAYEDCLLVQTTKDEYLVSKEDQAFIALARDALPYWIRRAQELEKVLRGYEQWEADLLMNDQAWGSGLPHFTQELQDKWMELQGQRNRVLRKVDERERMIKQMTGCEMINCKWFVDGKCTELSDYVNKYTGEEMCSRNPDAIPMEEFERE